MKTVTDSFTPTNHPLDEINCKQETQNLKVIWAKILENLPKKIKQTSIETWLRPCLLVEINDQELVIAVKNEFSRKLIAQSYSEAIHKSSKEVLAASYSIRFTTSPKHQTLTLENDLENSPIEENETDSLSDKANSKTTSKAVKTNSETKVRQKSFAEISPEEINYRRDYSTNPNNGISNKLRFDNFVACKANIGAVSFAKAIVENQLGSYYNSLFITSDVGLGKTHLLHAVANEALRADSFTKVRYIKAEDYVNEFVLSIKNKSYENFKKKFRNLDLLLLDEAQFLDGKKSTQQEFCSNFDAIISSGGKVIIASSKVLDDYEKIEKKLKSRLQGSLIAELSPVDYQARIAIIENKIQAANLKISCGHKVALAEKFNGNVRELEGALLKISALNNFSDLDILEIDSKTISDMFGAVYLDEKNNGISIQKITRLVAEKLELRVEDLQSAKRSQAIAQARHIAIFLSNEFLEISYQRIGEFFGGRKHSSVIHSIKTVSNQLNSNLSKSKDLKKLLDDIRSSLRE
ncbi:MAG: chromosomal replication initiator protein DnaA [Candidatus Melainabacteria bacterium]|nr:chromosomal replication initiator protein DnaA [Candidatus Melainabacteria bacterium]